MSNSFLTKKFFIVNKKKKSQSYKGQQINTNNKLKVIKKSLDKHGKYKTMSCPPQTYPYIQKHMASDHIHV